MLETYRVALNALYCDNNGRPAIRSGSPAGCLGLAVYRTDAGSPGGGSCAVQHLLEAGAKPFTGVPLVWILHSGGIPETLAHWGAGILSLSSRSGSVGEGRVGG